MKRSSSVLTSTVTRARIVLGEDSPIIDGGVVLDSQEANHNQNTAGSADNDNSAKVESAASSKSNEEVDFITTAILKNSLFGGLSETSLKLLVNGFELSEASRGAELVTQGDSCTGDYVYLLSDGECKVIVDGQIVPEPYGTIKPASVFGEQGFLYDEPRAATIRALSDTVLYYRVRGELFAEVMAKPKEELAGMRAIDEAINQVSGTDSLYGGAVILPYKPERMWLWRQFDGTVLKISIRPTLLNMALCVAFVVYARYATGEDIFEVGVGTPDKSLPFVQNLEMFGKIWDLEKNLTTFILTFFLNQSFAFWNKVYQLARDVQGKISDYNLLVVTNAKRDEEGALTVEADQLITDIACYSRLFHILMWAGKSERFKVLGTPDGLKRLESRGLMDSRQLEVLQSSKLEQDQLHTAPLEWLMVRANQAMEQGHMAGDTAACY